MSGETRVLVAAPVFPPMVGGAELLAYEVASNLRSLEVHVVTLGHPEGRSFDERMPLAVTRARRRSRDPHSLKELNARVVATAVRFRPHALLSMHVALTPAALPLKLVRVPCVQYVYAKEFGRYPRASSIAMRRADAVIAISRYTASLAQRFGARPERIHRILPGVDAAGARRERGGGNGKPTLITVSRLDEPYKGHDVILEALPLIRRAVPDATWVVVGDGPLRTRIEKAAASLPDGAVQVLGRVGDEERDEWLRRADVFVLPSRIPDDLAGGEGFGIAALEASAQGLPVVAGKHGGTADAVVDEETGLLVDPASPAAVADAVVRLLRDPDEATRMGEAGWRRAKELSWDRVGASVSEVIADVIAHRRRSSHG